MAAGERAPRAVTLSATMRALAAGETGDAVVRVPFDGTIQRVTYIPVAQAYSSGAGGQVRTFRGYIRDSSGANRASAVIRSVGSPEHAIPAFRGFTMPWHAGTNQPVVAGEVVNLTSYPTSTGIADPGGTWYVTFARG
jgi:hypothetical protein